MRLLSIATAFSAANLGKPQTRVVGRRQSDPIA